MKALHFILLFCVATFVSGCGHSDSFVVKGTVDGKPNMNLRVVYYSDGKLGTGITVVREGVFDFKGNAPEHALVEIYDNDYRLMGRIVTVNGEDMELTLDRLNPYKIKADGNELSKRWAAFLNKNVEDLMSKPVEDRNAIVAEYVQQNTSDPLSELLMISEYDSSTTERAFEADSLLRLLTDEAKIYNFSSAFVSLLERVAYEKAVSPVTELKYLASGNKLKTFKTSDNNLSLIALSNDDSRRDSIVEILRDLDKHSKKGIFAILDLSADIDTVAWHRSVAYDSVEWQQGWAIGGISGQALDSLGIPTLPYFIVADTTGKQLWRGNQLTEAKTFIIAQLTDSVQQAK